MYFSIILAHDGNVLRRYENDMSSEVCNEVGMALECSARRADGAGRYVRLDECGLAGQTMYSALRAWQIERRFGGIDHSDWLKIIGNVIPRLAAGRNAVGEYPFVFDEMDGSGAEYESFGGVWCLAASAYWALLTGDHSDLDGMLLSERHYHDRYVAHMECYGCAAGYIESRGFRRYIGVYQGGRMPIRHYRRRYVS